MSFIYILGGINHFIKPEFYKQLMPPFLPYHYELIFISGVIELLLGVGLYFSKTRKLSAIGIIALLIAIYPANIYMWKYNIQIDGNPTPAIFHYIRLPFQFILMYWAYYYYRKEKSN